MIRVQLACDGSSPGTGLNSCQVFESPHLKIDEANRWISATLDEHGWVRHGDQHLCPQHNPAMQGERVTVRGSEYTEIAPGVRVRIPSDHPMFELTIEVQRDDRECHGHVGAICGGGNGPYGAS